MRETKRSKLNRKPAVEAVEWFSLAMQTFPELERAEYDPSNITQIPSICVDLAYRADKYHRLSTNDEFLCRCYDFFRWSIRRAGDPVKQHVAHRFFDTILDLSYSKKKCENYLNWDDIDLFCSCLACEPDFEDIANFERLCDELKSRWMRHQKLPEPTEFAQQDGPGQPPTRSEFE